MPNIYYCYFFWDWLYKSVADARTELEAKLALYHNRANRKWLLTYATRWFMVCLSLFGSGTVAQASVWLMAFLFTCFACAVPVLIVALVSWLMFRRIAYEVNLYLRAT